MEEALGRKQEVLPELKDAYRRAKDRAKDAKAAITQQGNLSGLKNQLAWSFVDEIERVRRAVFLRLSRLPAGTHAFWSACRKSRSAKTWSPRSARTSWPSRPTLPAGTYALFWPVLRPGVDADLLCVRADQA